MGELEKIQLMHLCSQVFPTGIFSHSFGYEMMLEDGFAIDAKGYRDYLEGTLQMGNVAVEAAIIKFTYCYPEKIDEWDTLCSAIKPTKELRSASIRTGRAFLKVFQQMYPENPLVKNNLKKGNYAVAFGIASRYLHIPLEDALSGYITSTLLSGIQVGIKLIPLGQTEGQLIMKDSYQAILECIEQAKKMKEDDIFAFTPIIDIASMRHEEQFSRMYMS